MIRAASLIYAIFISLVIGILCYSLVLTFSLNLNLENHFELRRRLLTNNDSALEYLKANYNTLGNEREVFLFPKENDIKTYFEESPWGMFRKYTVISMAKKDSVRQDILMADRHLNTSPALYLRDNDTEFKIAGKTEINGNIFISGYGLKKTTITGNSGFYEPKFTGMVFRSDKILPKVESFKNSNPEASELLLLEDIRETSLINSFDRITKIIEVENILENIRLKGNIILRSKDTLSIMPSAILEDVIIEAPKVVFRSGNQGNVQVFSTHEIELEKDVKLNYPSVLVVSSDDTSTEKKIIVGESSVVEGTVILYGNGLIDENKNTLIIENDAEITGDVYCDGKLSLYGIVKGSVFASALLYKTDNSQYYNLIFNGKILTDQLPANYFQVSLLEDFKSKEPLIIKKI